MFLKGGVGTEQMCLLTDSPQRDLVDKGLVNEAEAQTQIKHNLAKKPKRFNSTPRPGASSRSTVNTVPLKVIYY